MTILTALVVALIVAVLIRLVAVVRHDDVRHIPTSHWVEPASAHDRWERIAG